jgi:hypothetical protein
MSARRDPDQLIHRFLLEGSERLHDQVYDAVRANIEQRPQRVVVGPWRKPFMSKFLTFGLGATAVVVALLVGTRLLAPPGPPGPGGPPVASPPVSASAAAPSAEATSKPEGFFGGIVQYQLDGADATTEIDAVADGATVSGTAVTTRGKTEHRVRLECAARDGDGWAVGGTIEKTTVSGERAGVWSAVIVQDGSPQRISIWLSDPKSEQSDCDGWLAVIPLADFDQASLDENFERVESGALVPPPDGTP